MTTSLGLSAAEVGCLIWSMEDFLDKDQITSEDREMAILLLIRLRRAQRRLMGAMS